MKMRMTKMLGVLALSAVCVLGVSNEAKAANNTQGSAKEIKVNQTYTFNNPTEKEVWYKAKMSETGSFAIQFDDAKGSTSYADGGNWELYIKMGNRIMVVNDYVLVQDKLYVSPKNGCVKDSTVYVCVKTGYGTEKKDYKLKIVNDASDVWETENNGTKKTADKVKIGKEYHAIFDESDDLDWFGTTVSKTGYLTVGVKKAYAEKLTYNSLDMTIYLDGKVVYDEMLLDVSNKSYFTSSKIGVKKGQKVHVRFGGKLMDVGSEYMFVINNKADKYFETEDNGSKKKANTLTLNKKMTATYSTVMDEDWFSYRVQKDGTYKVYLGWLDGNVKLKAHDWDVYVGTKKVAHEFYDTDCMKKVVTIKAKKGQMIYVNSTLSAGYLVGEKQLYGVKITK